jgi:hypothetical protein
MDLWEPINSAYKPSLNVTLNNLGPKGLEKAFGAIYDTGKSRDPWADNVGITPIILNHSNRIQFQFKVEFESKALPEDGS